MKAFRWFFCSVMAAALLGSSALGHESDSMTVQVGAGQDTTVVGAFFPATTRVRVGETVTFRLMGDEPHTVTFLGGEAVPPFAVPAEDGSGKLLFNPQVAFPSGMPGSAETAYDGSSFLNSGLMTHEPTGPDAPPNDHMTVTFSQPGSYEYVCLLHPWMKGTVVVEPETVAVTESHEELDRQAAEEMTPLLELAESLPLQRATVRSEAGPNGSKTWYVNAGAVDIVTADPRAAAYAFLPETLTITAGDTVVWSSPVFHTVTFSPVPPGPEFIIVEPQEQGPPQLVLNPEVLATVKPSGVYDPAQYYNSGVMGPYTEIGYSWALTFDEPGTYEYDCAVHREMGMKGSVTVLPRAGR